MLRGANVEYSVLPMHGIRLAVRVAGHSNGIMRYESTCVRLPQSAARIPVRDGANDAAANWLPDMRSYYRFSHSATSRGAGVSAEAAKYWAFISYSHRDAKIAGALQRAIETYRMPRRLAGTVTGAGEVPAFLKPLFRDRDEMQAGADLKASVREALAQSRYLIVVCSPSAASSPWVNQEIIEYKKLHGESRVLALIVAGEPFASRMPGREAEECFPEALRYALTPEGEAKGAALEPIAADFRRQGDGKRLAMLKLIAGMVGLGVDQLVRRDAQRRARQLIAVAAASICGMAAMAILTVMAVQARNEAQSQRVQAENLIEFMLGDLRKKLVPVGRLDVLDAVGEKALGYYAAQDPDRLDATALGHRSRAMHVIGEMREQRGQLAGALDAFRNAAETTAELLERAPNDGQRIFDHAQSVYWVGYIAWRRGQAQVAEDAFLKYRELAKQLVRIDPSNLDWQMEFAYANENVGVVQLEQGRVAEALQSFLAKRDTLSPMLGARPDLAFEQANNYGWIAKALESAGEYRKAIDAQQDKLLALRVVPDSDKNRKVQQLSANAEYELGRLELLRGRAEVAARHAHAAAEMIDALVAIDPANKFWLSESCFIRLGLAEIEVALGNVAPARAEQERAAAQVARLIASDATAMNWQVRLQGLSLGLAGRLALAQRTKFPQQEVENYLAGARHFEAQGKSLTPEQAQILAATELMLGDSFERDGRHDLALEHWRNTSTRLAPLVENGNLPAVAQMARAQLRLGKRDEARKLAQRVAASNYRHPAYADLVSELDHAAGRG